jgi:segregation and condensation protein B
METRSLQPIVEALLFASDSPVPMGKIRSIVDDVTAQQVDDIVAQLNGEYENQGRSFHIIEVAGGFQFATHPQYASWIKRLYRGRRLPRLSSAALETLAIIAFKGPIIRSEIEAIRGVSTEGVLKTLLERNLITVTGRQEGPGRPLLYATTQDFLIYFGLKSLSDLPKPKELEELLGQEENKTFEKQTVVQEELAYETQ